MMRMSCKGRSTLVRQLLTLAILGVGTALTVPGADVAYAATAATEHIFYADLCNQGEERDDTWRTYNNFQTECGTEQYGNTLYSQDAIYYQLRGLRPGYTYNVYQFMPSDWAWDPDATYETIDASNVIFVEVDQVTVPHNMWHRIAAQETADSNGTITIWEYANLYRQTGSHWVAADTIEAIGWY